MAAILLWASLASAQFSGLLHAQGTQLVNSSGSPVQLRGVNLGAWLYVEPWMWGTFYFGNYEDGQGEQDKLNVFLHTYLTQTQIDTFWKTYRTNYIQRADITQIKANGFNCVRVPLDYRLFLDASGNVSYANFGYLDNLMAWCNSVGVYAILDMHCVPGSPYTSNSNNLFASPSNQTTLARVWTAIAGRYSTNAAIAGWDLINEPVVSGDTSLRTEQVSLTNIIRKVDKNHVIWAEGDFWDSALDILGAPWDTNMGFSDHNYGSSFPNNLPHDQGLATQYGIPLWMGEYGYNSNNWIAAQEQLLNSNNSINGVLIQSHWTLWSWKANAIWSPEKYAAYSAFQPVLNYLNNGGAAPTSAQVYEGFMNLANCVSFTYNKPNIDVVDATTRPAFLSATKPFANLAIPGVIPATSYDLGPEGLAYHDTVSSNTGGMGSGFQDWNSGWTYRNDGADVTTFTTAGVAKTALGYIDAGEWTQYTAAVTPGNYAVTITYAGPGGQMHVEVNGINASGTITLPASPNGGDWGSYTTLVVPSVPVVGFGSVPVHFVCDTAGYNLASVQFSVVTGGIPLNHVITIKADSNNDYLVANPGTLLASEVQVGSNAKKDQFKILTKGGNKVVIESMATGNLLSFTADPTNPVLVAANQNLAQAAIFIYVDAGGGKFYLYCPATGGYVSADQNLGNPPPLSANRPSPQGWETFEYSVIQ